MSGLFDVPLIDSLMRFATEFRDYELRDFIVDGIVARYPSTLNHWDISVERFGTDASANDYKCQDVDVLGFARTHGILCAIPTILYRISFSLSLVCRTYSSYKHSSYFQLFRWNLPRDWSGKTAAYARYLWRIKDFASSARTVWWYRQRHCPLRGPQVMDPTKLLVQAGVNVTNPVVPSIAKFGRLFAH